MRYKVRIYAFVSLFLIHHIHRSSDRRANKDYIVLSNINYIQNENSRNTWIKIVRLSQIKKAFSFHFYSNA